MLVLFGNCMTGQCSLCEDDMLVLFGHCMTGQ